MLFRKRRKAKQEEQALEFLEQDENQEAPKEVIEDPDLEAKIIEALKTVYDPEIPVNIYDLGLIYKIAIDSDKAVKIDMTLTAPGCPVAETFPGMIANAVKTVEEITDVEVELVWEPPWTMDLMSEAARLQLGML